MTRSRISTQPPRTSRDRWLVAYADMLTLLFAVFASLYAARVDFIPPSATASAASAGVLPGGQALWTQVQQVIERTGALSGLETRRDSVGLVITLPEAGAFPAGRAELSPEAQRVIRELSGILKSSNGMIRVEGHTDDVPIHTPTFASNWELSTARATQVLQFLVTQGGIPASRLSASGFGEFHPRVPNTSESARAKNRRVDLIVLNASGGAIPR